MAGLNLYEVSIPVFIRGMNMLENILTKAEEHAKEKGLDADAEYPGARLIADMHPLTFQIQTSSNMAKKAVQRITGADIGVWEDDEKTMGELHARVRKTLDLLKGVDESQIVGKEDVLVSVPVSRGKVGDLPTKQYLFTMAIPQFFFHAQTAYAILRMKGVPLGKADFLSKFMAPAE